MVAVALYQRQVSLGRRVRKHVEVHGRSHKHGSLHGEIGRYEHVVSNGVCHLTQRACRARCHEHGVGPQPERHMRVPCAVALREEVGDHRLLREGRQGDGRYKLFAGRRNDDLHLGSTLHEQPYDVASLVGRY